VDASGQGQGIGAELLRFVLGLASGRADGVGCLGVVVDAKPGASGFYGRYGFTEIEAVEGQSDARPPPSLMFLSMSAIRKARGR
jgi:GNAT superfamily N-acetyltransferase